jgi:cell division topological specificity factor
MNFFGLFKRRELPPATAPVARERLQVLLAHERASPGQANLLGSLKQDIMAAIARHVPVGPEAVKVKLDKRNTVSILRIAIDIPGKVNLTKAA